MSSCNSPKMKMANKTETEYNMKSIKFLLLTITSMFIIVAGLMIVLGLSVYSRFHSFTFLYESEGSGHFFTPSILVVMLGLAMMIVTLFGFFGSLKESTCMVNLYALVLFIVFIVELVVVCVVFNMDDMKIMQYIEIPVEYYTTDAEIQRELDILQPSLNCCGSESYLDYLSQEFTSDHSTVVATDHDSDFISLILPTSCCAIYNNAICSRIRPIGCKRALVNVVLQNASVLGVLGISVMFIQVLGITFALLLARCIRKMKSERALMKWKICEQMILARQIQDSEKQAPEISTIYIKEEASSKA